MVRSKIKYKSPADRIFGAAIVLISILVFAIVAYPLWFVLIASVSNSNLVNLGKVTIFPKDIRFYGYQQVFQDARIWRGYLNTIIYVVLGTLLNMAVTMPAAYALSRPDFKGRGKIMFYFVFTMFFSGGLVPLYMTISSLGLISTRTILITIVAVNTYNLIIARTFIESSIPNDLYEAAVIDGCSHFKYFFKVVMPLSKAVVAVLVLYYAVFHWNDFFNALMFNSNNKFEPLQIVLRRILLLNEAFASGSGAVGGGYAQSSADQVKYAVIIVSTLPILCVYPFIQKYFEKGVMIGAVKG
ncbi:carbohydrate ABC transporter permease [uncultured Robinsoniella sp.]|uniref:carbohydrate ABC transporter permease n=1 Tax=uncultured Robinsoniella sp. TaxID=904190 RepID=UPI00374F56A3